MSNDDFEDADNTPQPFAIGSIVNGRYNLPDPRTGRPRQWTRTTNFIQKIQDDYALKQWDKRKIIEGLARREDLYAEALTYAIPIEGEEYDKEKVNELVERCKDAAGGNEGARVGTMLHAFTDRHDIGVETHAPTKWMHRIEEYAAALTKYRLTVVEDLIERKVVNLEYGCAGRFDRGLMSYTGDLLLGDLKSQAAIYSYMSPAMQFTMYVDADCMWDADNARYVDMPAFNKDRGMMVWLPARGAGCQVHWVDLEKGRRMLKLCKDVYEAQKESKRVNTVGGHEAAPSNLAVVEAYARRLRDAEDERELSAIKWEAVGHDAWVSVLEDVRHARLRQLTSQQENVSL